MHCCTSCILHIYVYVFYNIGVVYQRMAFHLVQIREASIAVVVVAKRAIFDDLEEIQWSLGHKCLFVQWILIGSHSCGV